MSVGTDGSATPSQVIGAYLNALGAAGAGAGLDPALVNDMLADAEQHLWNAVSDGVPAVQAVADFGDVADVVKGYGGTVKPAPASAGADMNARAGRMAAEVRGLATTPQAASFLASTRRVLGVWADRYAWGALALFIVGYVLATAYFSIVTTWGALALGTMILVVGFPLLVGLLGFCRVLSLLHGRLIELATGVRMPRRTAPVAGVGLAGFWGRIKLWLSDGRSWLSVAFLLGNFPVAVLLFAMFTGLLAASLSLIVAPLAVLLFPGDYQVNIGIWNGADMPFVVSLLLFIVGLGLLTGTLWLAKGCGWLYAQVVKAIQVTRPVAGLPVHTGGVPASEPAPTVTSAAAV